MPCAGLRSRRMTPRPGSSTTPQTRCSTAVASMRSWVANRCSRGPIHASVGVGVDPAASDRGTRRPGSVEEGAQADARWLRRAEGPSRNQSRKSPIALWIRGSEAGRVSVVDGWLVPCPAPRRVVRRGCDAALDEIAAVDPIYRTHRLRSRQGLVGLSRFIARAEAQRMRILAAADDIAETPVTGPPRPGWPPDPGCARHRTPPRGVGCRVGRAVDPDRRRRSRPGR